MEEIKEKKRELREHVAAILGEIPETDLSEKQKTVENKLFEFANFLEAKIALLYLNKDLEINTRSIIERSLMLNKIVVLPFTETDQPKSQLFKIDDITQDIITDADGNMVPDTSRCKKVPIDCIDIAIVPGLAFDEKGGRIGAGDGFYDLLIPKLPATARKVAVALEEQLVSQIPMESHDKYVDIIITNSRVIYKI